MEIFLGVIVGALVALMIVISFGVIPELEKQTCLQAGYSAEECGVRAP